MNFNSHIDQLFVFLIYFATLVIHVKSEKYGPLNFDRENLELIDVKKIIENGDVMIGHELAVACPPHSSRETGFNSRYSHGKNSLFVKGTYGTIASPSSVPEDICTDVYKPSIIYDKINDEFVFGYEVYYNSNEYKNFKDSNYANFDSVANAYSKVRGFMSGLSNSKPKLELKQDSGPPITLGFVWLSLLILKFDNSIMSPTQAMYSLSRGVAEINVVCNDYNLGNEVYQKKKNDYVDSLYQNQVNIFNNIEIPAPNFGCETKNKCLTKYSLVPSEEFRFRSPEPKSISCSNLTTIPIWRRTIQNILQKLDKFLYALVNFAYKSLTVISGVQGQLEMKKKNELQRTSKITLSGKSKIPVPDIVYKTVIHEFSATEITNGPPYYKTSHVLNAVIIVVHNDPQFDPKDAICPPDNCEKWGWSEIASSRNIFCCPRNEEIVKKLGMSYDKKFSKELNLMEFPIYDAESLTLRTKNIQQSIIDEMKRMFAEESIPEGVAQGEDV